MYHGRLAVLAVTMAAVIWVTGMAARAAGPDSNALGAQTPRAGAPARGPQVPPGVEALRDVAYVKEGHKAQVLDLYIPKTDKPLPLVVWVHGGAWLGGSKSQSPANLLLGKGYAVASIEYRMSQVAIFPAQIHDCKAAIRWLRATAKEHHIDPDRIGVWGSSAGGHLVALLGTSAGVKEMDGDLGEYKDVSTSVQCVVDFFGPTDLAQMKQGTPGLVGAMDHDSPRAPEALLIGGAVPENKEKAAKANPINYISRNNPPFLIMHGDKDSTVPINQSELLVEALKKTGVDATFTVVKGAGHGFRGPAETAAAEAFFDKWLKK